MSLPRALRTLAARMRAPRGISSSVERELPKLERRVRFPYPACMKAPLRRGFRVSGYQVAVGSHSRDRLAQQPRGWGIRVLRWRRARAPEPPRRPALEFASAGA